SSTLAYSFCSNGNSCGTGATLILTKTGGGAFSLNSIDVSDWNGSATGSVTLAGALEGGGTASTTVSTGPTWATDLLSGFDDVISVQITGGSSSYADQIDNLQLNAANNVPEPMTLALLGIGLLGIRVLCRRTVRPAARHRAQLVSRL
ncbi:MAG: PEP-CTERM sorting domain-containing protein, partial [Candidatus Korobacteraceae bacterium]